MLSLYHEIIYRPILNLLIGFYNIIPGQDIGVAIILITIVTRIVLAPFMHKSLKGQQVMNKLQPKLNEIRERFKEDKEAQAKAIMELYKEHKINPLSSCLPMLAQLPVLIALYQVLNKALHGNLEGLYSFVQLPERVNPYFLGAVDLSAASAVFAIVAGLLQYVQTKAMMPTEKSNDSATRAMNVQALYFFPLITVFFAWKLPAGLPLYWIVNTLAAIFQQWWVKRKE